MIDILYKSNIRPHLEYANVIWCPYLKVDIERLEKIQRKVTKIPLELKDLSYKERLKYLGLTSLDLRRQRGDLI